VKTQTKRISPKHPAFAHAGYVAALLCAFVTFPAMAQQEAPMRQLPAEVAGQQVPQAFPDQTAQPAPQAEAPQVQSQSAAQESQNRLQEILQGGQPSTPSTPATANGAAPTSAELPAAQEVPAEPEQKRLVPATPMGTEAAQNVNNATPNPVEDAAAAADLANTPQPAPTAQQPDMLERYTAQTDQMDAANGDALPQVTKLNRVRLEGDGFENVSGNVQVIDVDGSLQDNADLQEEIKTEAFDAAITGMFPLTPEQIQGLLKQYDKTQEAAKTPPYDAPKPEISVQNISLDPGVMPPTIKTAVGNVTTLNILDATGAPWPVQDVTWAGDYEIVEPEEGGHIIRITPMSHFARGNIVIRLLTLKTPLTLTLETGRDIVQYRVDARVPEYGPFANAPLMQGGKSMVAGSSELTSILDGVPPGGAVRLDVAGVDGRTTAYSVGSTTYVRTPLTLLSPAWQSSVSSADGMNVYALNNAPVLLLSDGGEFMRAVLKEKEDLLDE